VSKEVGGCTVAVAAATVVVVGPQRGSRSHCWGLGGGAGNADRIGGEMLVTAVGMKQDWKAIKRSCFICLPMGVVSFVFRWEWFHLSSIKTGFIIFIVIYLQ
jgi:hypothetical protein